MKRVLLFTIPLALATPLFAEEKLPAYLQKCPFGHKDLILLPISYGFPAEDKNSKKEKGIGKLPPTFEGGCVIDPSSPKNVVGCPKCGFYYQPLWNNDWSQGDWTISVSDPTELFKPLSPVISGFPGFDEKSKSLDKSYTQYVDRDGRLMSESITFQRKGKLTDAEASLKPWLISKGIDPKSASRSGGGIQWEKARLTVSVGEERRMLYFSATQEFAD